MIICDSVSKSFDGKEVIKDLSLHIKEGEIVSLDGVSGSGKTTLINILCGFIKPDSGDIAVNGKISAVFQEDRLFESFTSLENVMALSNIKDKAEKRKKALYLLELMGLKGAENKKPQELSGGMKRRVTLAGALAYHHDILILDEPFNGIDGETKLDVIKNIKELERGKTVILITHSAEEKELMEAEKSITVSLG